MKNVRNKETELKKVNEEIKSCKICPIGKIGKVVVGEGNADAKFAFIGEAPGKKEAETGRPFVGRSGKLLRSLIARIGLLEKEIYITSPVKYLPKNGMPSVADIKHGTTHLKKQLDVIDPKIIILLGATAAKALLSEKISVMKMHGNIVEENGIKYLITLHPAAALRFPQYQKLIEEDFEKLKKLSSN